VPVRNPSALCSAPREPLSLPGGVSLCYRGCQLRRTLTGASWRNGRGPPGQSYSKGPIKCSDFLPESNFLWGTPLSHPYNFISLLTSETSPALSGFRSPISLQSGHSHWITISAEGNKLSHRSDGVFWATAAC